MADRAGQQRFRALGSKSICAEIIPRQPPANIAFPTSS
jgi:hypothetical protein